jgi:hypothetical protein
LEQFPRIESLAWTSVINSYSLLWHKLDCDPYIVIFRVGEPCLVVLAVVVEGVGVEPAHEERLNLLEPAASPRTLIRIVT